MHRGRAGAPSQSMNGGTSWSTRDSPATNAQLPIVVQWCTATAPESEAREWIRTCPPRSVPLAIVTWSPIRQSWAT